MLVYILKSAACLAILFVFYKLFLEKESIHRFKRFYLLGALVFSMIVPALVFTEYVVVESMEYSEIQPSVVSDYDYIGVPRALEKDVLDIEPVLWTIYFLGFTFFGLKFIRNLGQIIVSIRKNPKQKSSSFVQVLLQENFPPHTFFKYIFLNKKKLESNEIPKEVLLHEETHAKQKHSLDVVFIELLQVIFWFNPIVYLFKKAIKLNHEFLADQAVLEKDIDKATYQNTLLSYLSPDSQNKYQSKMANAINYSSTRLTVLGKTFEFGSAVGQVKKRFTIMKTHTSKKAVLLRSLLLLPLLAVLILSFSETKLIEVYADNDFRTNVAIDSREENTKRFILNIDNSLILLNEKLVDLESFTQEVDNLTQSWEETDYTSIPAQVNFSNTPLEFLEKVEEEFKKTHYSKSNEGMKIFPKYYKKGIQQKPASKKQLATYNALAKKYNTMLAESKSIQIKKQDVDRLEYIYSLMSDEQKADAEPFPDFPEPPAPPKAPKGIKGEASTIPPPQSPFNQDSVTFYGTTNNDIIAIKVPKPHKSPLNTKDLEVENSIQHVKKEIQQVKYNEREVDSDNLTPPAPPTPPKPPSPLDHVIEMAKEGAIFKYKGKTISSDEAIDLIKNNEHLSISTKRKNNETPIVKISRNL